MTQGTSAHGESLSRRWTDVGQERASFGWRIDSRQVAGGAAPLQLLALSVIAGLALGLMLTNATDTALHLAVLAAVGALALFVALRPGQPAEPAQHDDRRTPDEPSQLLAQMHHELRTPLNAMIGFSEVMLHELHGPLGNARYQEYAAHISESGGRLLKSSEEALAITEVMTALMADRRRGRRERLGADALVRDAWAAATGRLGDNAPALKLAKRSVGAIVCERRPVAQALEHLLREACSRVAAGEAVQVAGRRRSGRQILEVRAGAEPPPAQQPAPRSDRGYESDVIGCNLSVILARLLLETQGATLACTQGDDPAWAATIEFPARE
jgi:signal transduction histidine kinase